MWTTFTNRVRKAFTDAADQYDILTGLHKEIGRELVKKNVRLDAESILDVGCGTGYAANKAKFFFPESRIVGLDIAEGMLSKAAQLHEGIAIDWVQADAHDLPFKNTTFGLIISNLAYQWVMDLPHAFKEARRILTPGGVFSATLFGQRTCEELTAALRVSDPQIKVRHLPSVEDVRAALAAAGFADVHVDYELIKVQFKDVRELMGWLKAIGANNLGEGQVFLGKQALAKTEAYYRAQFPYGDGICASFEVVWAYGKK